MTNKHPSLNKLRKILDLSSLEDLYCNHCKEPLYHKEEIIEAFAEWFDIPYLRNDGTSYRLKGFLFRLNKSFRIFNETKHRAFHTK